MLSNVPPSAGGMSTCRTVHTCTDTVRLIPQERAVPVRILHYSCTMVALNLMVGMTAYPPT